MSYRALLKQILAPYRATLEYDSFGKPRLRNSKLNISVAHSGDYSAVIISSNSAVGIDIERLKDRIYRIKDRFLTAEEDKNNFDYIFSTSQLSAFKGIKYKIIYRIFTFKSLKEIAQLTKSNLSHQLFDNMNVNGYTHIHKSTITFIKIAERGF